jgi:hypothetical protein
MIFVFGSNEGGYHGKGAALTAKRKYGAMQGVGIGPMGQSYAIPTVGWRIGDRLPFEVVEFYVQRFIVFARINPEHNFQVTRIGCGLAGFYDKDIAPLFKYAPANCFFDEVWAEFLGPKKQYWGTYP